MFLLIFVPLFLFPIARKEWNKLNSAIKQQFVKKLRDRLEKSKVPSAALRGVSNRYKIKLRQLGYRLVYRVNDEVITIAVVAIGKRERGDICENIRTRMQ